MTLMSRHAYAGLAAALAFSSTPAWAVIAQADFGSLVQGPAYFTNAPALPTAGVVPEPERQRSVTFEDSYSFTLGSTQSVLANVRASDAYTLGAGTAAWSLSLTLLDSDARVIATGTADPTASASTWKDSLGQGLYNVYTANGMTLTSTDLAAGSYRLLVSGTKSIDSPFPGIYWSQSYWGGLFVYPGAQATPDTASYYNTLIKGSSTALRPTVVAVPEPQQWLMLLLGLVGLSLALRRRRQAA